MLQKKAEMQIKCVLFFRLISESIESLFFLFFFITVHHLFIKNLIQ